jgi:ADP-ribosylation factor GTPase-activating protein 1
MKNNNHLIGSSHPQWASVNNGSFICMNCAAIHRSLGVNFSFVRSLSMDSWNEKQLKMMSLGGNKNLSEYFQFYELNEESV